MKEIDNDTLTAGEGYDEDEMFLKHVIDEDHELLYLDSYLGELFKKETLG